MSELTKGSQLYSKIPFIGSQFEKNHYSEIQIGIENHPAPGVLGVFLDKTGVKKAAHSTSGESDGINTIGNAKNIYKVKLDEDGNMDHVAYNINRGLTGFDGTIVAAFFNHRFVYQDHSHGIHNPKWVEALLQNSIEAVEAL